MTTYIVLRHAEALGWQRPTAKSFISQLRAEGYDLPHRRPSMVANGKRLAERRRQSLAAAA